MYISRGLCPNTIYIVRPVLGRFSEPIHLVSRTMKSARGGGAKPTKTNKGWHFYEGAVSHTRSTSSCNNYLGLIHFVWCAYRKKKKVKPLRITFGTQSNYTHTKCSRYQQNYVYIYIFIVTIPQYN